MTELKAEDVAGRRRSLIMTELKAEDVAGRLEKLAERVSYSTSGDLTQAASLIRSQAERNEKLEGALSDLLLRLDNKIALAPRIHRAYGHAYVLCAGIEACIKASNARAALERK